VNRWAAAGAAGAAIVTVIFATIGDGVESHGSGAVWWITEYGHTLTWLLLTATLALVAFGKGPKWLVNALGWGALASYATFLAAVFLA
jgi:hypothetical protein